MLGGNVEVESAFTVKLPAVLPDPVQTVVEHSAQESPPKAGETTSIEAEARKGLVLVGGDNPAQRDLMTRFLECEGFNTRTAPDGRTGLELARNLRPGAILLDVMMPGLDGWSVLSALKADPEQATIPVVMVTLINERGTAFSLGAADYMVKPVEWERFRQVMDRFHKAKGDVLVVDDDSDTRQRMRVLLEQQG